MTVIGSTGNTGFNKPESATGNLFPEPAQNDYQQLLLALADSLNCASPADYGHHLFQALKAVGEFCAADRIYVYNYDFTGQVALSTHEWCAEGIAPQQSIAEPLCLKSIASVVDCHLKGEAFYLASAAGVDKKGNLSIISKKQDVNSLALFPLTAGKNCFGFIGLDLIRKPGKLSATEILILKSLARMITAAELRMQSEQERRELKETYVELVEQAVDWIWEVDQDGYFTYVNARVEALTGFKAEEMIGKTPFIFMSDKESKKIKNIFEEAVKSASPLNQLENVFKHKKGYDIYFETSGIPVFDQDGKIKGFRGISREVTAQSIHRQKMEYLSMHDSLTGLHNRAFFEEELQRLQVSREYPIAITFIDVNNMKVINDALGHGEGDRLLKSAAKLLKQFVRSSDLLARIGGDEFVLVLTGSDEKAAEKIISRIKKQVVLYNKQNETFPLSFSIGLAVAQNSETFLKDVLETADDLMYRDKMLSGRGGKLKGSDLLPHNYFEEYSPGMRDSKRLARICMVLGKELNLEKDRLRKLDLLVKAHNLGKAGISKSILYKQGNLSKEEKKVICLHPEKGYRIALNTTELSSIADLILKHHEWWNGKGYPLGLKEKEIPLECRILSVADAFAAMTEGRVYKDSCSGKEAVDELKSCAGSQFDPEVVQVFYRLHQEGDGSFPPALGAVY